MGHITADHYLAGMVGLSLLRHWYEDADRNEARLAELANILDHRDDFPYSMRLDPLEHELIEGYAEWSQIYDGPNPLIEVEEIVTAPLFADLATHVTDVLDAACGTGRQAERLRRLGCDVVGVDQSAAMLDVARSKLPDVRFELGDLAELPFADESFDLAVVSLALCHLADPTDAVAELSRVVRRGGVLVVTDPHPDGGVLGGQAFYGGIADGRPMTWVRNHRHQASTYLRAAREAGLLVEDCIEEPFTDAQMASSPASLVFPEAASIAMEGLAGLWVWVFRRPTRS